MIPKRREIKRDYNFEKVDIFLRVRGRLPDGSDDMITQELLDTFCTKYENNELTEGIIPLGLLYRFIKDGKIIAQEEQPKSKE